MPKVFEYLVSIILVICIPVLLTVYYSNKVSQINYSINIIDRSIARTNNEIKEYQEAINHGCELQNYSDYRFIGNEVIIDAFVGGDSAYYSSIAEVNVHPFDIIDSMIHC